MAVAFISTRTSLAEGDGTDVSGRFQRPVEVRSDRAYQALLGTTRLKVNVAAKRDVQRFRDVDGSHCVSIPSLRVRAY